MVEFFGGNMLLKAHCDRHQMLSTDYMYGAAKILCMVRQTLYYIRMYYACTGTFLCVCDHDQYWLEIRLVF